MHQTGYAVTHFRRRTTFCTSALFRMRDRSLFAIFGCGKLYPRFAVDCDFHVPYNSSKRRNADSVQITNRPT